MPTSSLKHLHLDTAATMIAAWKVDLEQQVVIHEMRPNRRPDAWMQSEFTGLGASTGRIRFHFHRWTHESSGRRSLCRINLGCPKTKNWGPSNDTLIPDPSIRRHGPLVPTLPQRPSGSCHHLGFIWASRGVSIWPSSLHKTKEALRPHGENTRNRVSNR